MKKELSVFRIVMENGEKVKEEKQGEYVPFDPVEGAWFFLKKKRGFVLSINEFKGELTSVEIEKFNCIFFSDSVELKTNRIVAANSRRVNKALDRSEIAELMGFEGKTAVRKATTLLNRFRNFDILHMEYRYNPVSCKKTEEWFVNPLLCKTYYRLSVDLFEMFRESITIMMKDQRVLLRALEDALEEKHTPQVKTMTVEEARTEIAKEQYRDSLDLEEMEDFIDEGFKKAAQHELIKDLVAPISKVCSDIYINNIDNILPKEQIDKLKLAFISFIADHVMEGKKITTKDKMNLMDASNKIIGFNGL